MKHVLLIDAAHLYMEGRRMMGTPNAEFDRGQLLSLSRKYVEDSGIELWRIYWFDAPSTPDGSQKVTGLAEFDDVHVVLGSRNYRGTQKGVDANLIRTLSEIANWPGETIIHVVAGDDDFIPAMNLATGRGLHVRLWHLEGSNGVTAALRQSVDRTRSVPMALYAGAFSAPIVSIQERNLEENLQNAARDYGYNLGVLTNTTQASLWSSHRPLIPREHYRFVAAAIASRLDKEDFVIESNQESVVKLAFWDGFDFGQGIQKQKDSVI